MSVPRWPASAWAILLSACTSSPPGAPRDAGESSSDATPRVREASSPHAADGSTNRGSGHPPTPSAHFVDVTERSGLSHIEAPSEPSCDLDRDYTCTSPRMTGGATAGDVDGDGWIDLYLTRLDAPDLLFRNVGGTFRDITTESGLTARLPSNGAAFGDVDDDGDLDLAVTTVGGSRTHLYVNQGDGTFVEAAQGRGVAMDWGFEHLGFTVCFGDYDRDGWLDLHTSHWGGTVPEPARTHTRLFRNRGIEAPGFYEDVTADAGVTLPEVDGGPAFAFTSSFADMDRDGWPDLVIAADFGSTRLYWNQGDGTFVDGTDDLGRGVPGDENGMGLAIGDVDGDGQFDWFVSSIHDPRAPCRSCAWGTSGNRLYRNLGDRTFEDATDDFGVREGFWGWGSALFDYDNDGDLDLGMTNGYVTEGDATAPFHDDPMRLWRNDGEGPWTEVAREVGLDDTQSGKSFLVLDYDRDGDLDVFITNNAGEPRLYRNDGGNARHWLRVRAPGRGARNGGTNRQGIGAKVEVRVEVDRPALVRELRGGYGYLGQSENVAHFGLGDAERVHEVRVCWPVTGQCVVRNDVRADRVLVLEEPG